ncbi:MAG: hypothetical protein ACPLTR_08475 [Thermacetogeniaceae bacterium]
MGVELAVVFIFLSVAAGAGLWLYMRWENAKLAGEGGELPGLPALKGAPNKSKKVKEASLKDLWEVEDVRRGVVVLSGGRYRIICRVSATDFWLLSDTEQNAIEDAAAAALMQLTFPVQVVMTSQAVDTRAAVEELRQGAARLSGTMQEMAHMMADYMGALMQEKAAAARQAYLVIPYDTPKGFDHAFGELQARLANLASAFEGARIRVEPLSSEAVLDLLSHALNRGRVWKPSEAVEAGALSLYIVSERSVANA